MSTYQTPEDSTADPTQADPTQTDPTQTGPEPTEQTLIIDEPTIVDSTAGSGTEPIPAQLPRMRTVVFGLVLLVVAGCVLIGELTDVTVDAGVVVLALMIGGGLLLIAGARRS